MCSNSNFNLSLFIYCVSLAKKRYVSIQSNTTAVSTGVTNIVSESQHFISPSSFSSSRSAKKKIQNSSIMILICLLGFMCTDEKIAHDTICLLCNKLLQNSS